MHPDATGLPCTTDACPPGVHDPAELHRRLAAAEARAANLETALISNRRIGMAVGILMTRYRLTEDRAFDLLREHSNRRNAKLARLAEEVVHTGDLEPIRLPRRRHGAGPAVSARWTPTPTPTGSPRCPAVPVGGTPGGTAAP